MNHYKHNVDITTEPFRCTDCEVYLADDGSELGIDANTEDYTNHITSDFDVLTA